MLKRFCLPVLVLMVLNLISCKQEGSKTANSGSNSNESDQTIRVYADRFEMDLFSVPFDSVAKAIPGLKKKYGPFFDIFTNRVISIGNDKDPKFPEYLKGFITDRYMFTTYQKVKEVYPDIHQEVSDLEGAFTIYNQEFPKKVIPHFYTLISGFNQSVITSDTMLGISLDKYLGPGCDFYEKLTLPMYQRRLMDRAYIASDAMKGWCYSEFTFSDSGENVLSNMIYEGKIDYMLRHFFPEKEDTILLGFSKKQLEWCKQNTEKMWTYMVENKMLFSTDYMTINKLINPAPFTSLFDKEAPGRAVIWIGYQIVDAYMKNNEVTLKQLMADHDFQKILEKSKFEPK